MVPLRLRDANQRKSAKDWEAYERAIAEGDEATPPPVYISVPGEREVEVAIYDSEGNLSNFVPVRAIEPSVAEQSTENTSRVSTPAD